jgi:hypothetical protein
MEIIPCDFNKALYKVKKMFLYCEKNNKNVKEVFDKVMRSKNV